MSRRVCKNIWLVSDCPHRRPGLKSPAPHIEIETGKEIPGKTGRGHTALGSTTIGIQQTRFERLVDGPAVMGTESGTGRFLGWVLTHMSRGEKGRGSMKEAAVMVADYEQLFLTDVYAAACLAVQRY